MTLNRMFDLYALCSFFKLIQVIFPGLCWIIQHFRTCQSVEVGYILKICMFLALSKVEFRGPMYLCTGVKCWTWLYRLNYRLIVTLNSS